MFFNQITCINKYNPKFLTGEKYCCGEVALENSLKNKPLKVESKRINIL